VPRARGDYADDEPDDQKNRSDSHCVLRWC
jgi:hypothetical protein